jgi:trehalose/maltose hydrolase-like predicted phosphorylase
VSGFGGLRDHGGQLMFDPALPVGISRLSFSIRWRGSRLHVSFDHHEVTYSLYDGEATEVAFRHDGEDVVVTAAEPVVRKLKGRRPLLSTPSQPIGREPAKRHAG